MADQNFRVENGLDIGVGGTIFSTTSSGNIGIGTTNPTTKLQIGGVLGFGVNNNIRIGDNDTGTNLNPATAYQNIFLGSSAGKFTSSGSGNIFLGREAGFNNNSGCLNNFLGYTAGFYNTSGTHNAFFGFSGGYKNTTGSYNTFLGSNIGKSTTASRKVIIGSGTADILGGLFDSPSPNKDMQFAVGLNTDPGQPNKYWLVGDENFNIGIGTTNPTTKLQVGGIIGFNDTNVRIGNVSTGSSITTGTYNNFFGVGAGNSTTTGCFNNFFGDYVGYRNTEGSRNSFFGSAAGLYNTFGTYNNFFGDRAGLFNTDGSNNNFFGILAGTYNTYGSYNNFFGNGAGKNNTIGNTNIFIGARSGISTSASRKVIFGSGTSFNLFDSPDTTKDTQFAVGVRTDANPSKYWLVGNENFNIGIGTTNPTSKLTVGGDVRVGINTSEGLILTSPNGTKYRLIVDNSGVLSTVLVT